MVLNNTKKVEFANLFFYSEKTLFSMTDFEKKVQNEIGRVKGLKGGTHKGGFKFLSGQRINSTYMIILLS